MELLVLGGYLIDGLGPKGKNLVILHQLITFVKGMGFHFGTSSRGG